MITVSGEHRCIHCNVQFKRHQDLQSHRTKGCELKPASRAGSKTERALEKKKQIAVQEAAGEVWMGSAKLQNSFNFNYLGFRFQADGDQNSALSQRMAIARARFGQLHEVWRSKKLPTTAKIRVYACAVVSVLTYGCEIWKFDEKAMRQLRGWNARCLAAITGRDFREETVEPTFDLLGRLRSRRLRWAGHILRLEKSSLLRQVLLAQAAQSLERTGGAEAGGLLMDAPGFESIEQLLALVGDRVGWRNAVHALLPEEEAGGKGEAKEQGASDAWMIASGHYFKDGEWIKY